MSISFIPKIYTLTKFDVNEIWLDRVKQPSQLVALGSVCKGPIVCVVAVMFGRQDALSNLAMLHPGLSVCCMVDHCILHSSARIIFWCSPVTLPVLSHFLFFKTGDVVFVDFDFVAFIIPIAVLLVIPVVIVVVDVVFIVLNCPVVENFVNCAVEIFIIGIVAEVSDYFVELVFRRFYLYCLLCLSSC